MKRITLASPDRKTIFYVCLSEKDGPNLEIYITPEFGKECLTKQAQTMATDIPDDKAQGVLKEILYLNPKLERTDKRVDLITEEQD